MKVVVVVVVLAAILLRRRLDIVVDLEDDGRQCVGRKKHFLVIRDLANVAVMRGNQFMGSSTGTSNDESLTGGMAGNGYRELSPRPKMLQHTTS